MKNDKQRPLFPLNKQENGPVLKWRIIKDEAPSCKWVEGKVDEKKEHMKLLYGEIDAGIIPVALLAKGTGNNFIVQFILKKTIPQEEANKIIEKVKEDLNFYLIEKHEKDPWAYAIYHTGTVSNMYSNVHWSYHPSDDRSKLRKAKGKLKGQRKRRVSKNRKG